MKVNFNHDFWTSTADFYEIPFPNGKGQVRENFPDFLCDLSVLCDECFEAISFSAVLCDNAWESAFLRSSALRLF